MRRCVVRRFFLSNCREELNIANKNPPLDSRGWILDCGLSFTFFPFLLYRLTKRLHFASFPVHNHSGNIGLGKTQQDFVSCWLSNNLQSLVFCIPQIWSHLVTFSSIHIPPHWQELSIQKPAKSVTIYATSVFSKSRPVIEPISNKAPIDRKMKRLTLCGCQSQPNFV